MKRSKFMLPQPHYVGGVKKRKDFANLGCE